MVRTLTADEKQLVLAPCLPAFHTVRTETRNFVDRSFETNISMKFYPRVLSKLQSGFWDFVFCVSYTECRTTLYQCNAPIIIPIIPNPKTSIEIRVLVISRRILYVFFLLLLLLLFFSYNALFLGCISISVDMLF